MILYTCYYRTVPVCILYFDSLTSESPNSTPNTKAVVKWQLTLHQEVPNQLQAIIYLFIFHCRIIVRPQRFSQGSLKVYLI